MVGVDCVAVDCFRAKCVHILLVFSYPAVMAAIPYPQRPMLLRIGPHARGFDHHDGLHTMVNGVWAAQDRRIRYIVLSQLVSTNNPAVLLLAHSLSFFTQRLVTYFEYL